MIFNSPKLRERRRGLKTNVNEAELANAAKGAKNKARAVFQYLLKLGFLPTQIADSFAISAGGATMYRNRVNTYLKQGMSKGTFPLSQNHRMKIGHRYIGLKINNQTGHYGKAKNKNGIEFKFLIHYHFLHLALKGIIA